MTRSTLSHLFLSATLSLVFAACSSKAPEPQSESLAAAASEDVASAISTSAAACHVGENGDEGFCTTECPCDVGEGDCDSSDECLPGLRCNFQSGPDFCGCPDPDRAGSGSFCSELCPCDEGGGDCDSDAECAPGLRCIRDIGAEFGYDANTDVCTALCPTESNGSIDFCSPECPCESGQGDCDSSEDCSGELSCFFNVGEEFGFDRDTDVCSECPPASLNGSSTFCSTTCTCSEGEGDCDVDADCEAGLTCFFDSGVDFGFDASTDVCAECAPDSRLGTFNFCAPGNCQCSDGQGDCDSNNDCAAGLTCFFDVGAEFGFDAETDVCAQCAPDSQAGTFNFCSPDCQCSHGEGDCDSDADCEAGLSCVEDNGADFGFEPTVDVCVVLL